MAWHTPSKNRETRLANRPTCLGQRFGPQFLHTLPALFAKSSVFTWDVFTLLHEKVKTSHVKTLLFAKSAGRVCKKWGPKRCPKQVDRFFIRKVDIFEGVCQATFWSLFAIFSFFVVFSLSEIDFSFGFLEKWCTFPQRLLVKSIDFENPWTMWIMRGKWNIEIKIWPVQRAPLFMMTAVATKLPQTNNDSNDNTTTTTTIAHDAWILRDWWSLMI